MALIKTEILRIDESACGCYREVVFGRVEVDAPEGLIDVKLPGFAGVIESVPVEDAVCRIGRSLDLSDEQARTDGMDGSCGEEVTLACFYGDFPEAIGGCAFFDRFGEGFFGDSRFQAFVDDCVVGGGDDVPAFGFWLTLAGPAAGLLVGVYLDAEDVVGIEELDEQWELSGELGVTGDLFGELLDQGGECLAGELSV